MDAYISARADRQLETFSKINLLAPFKARKRRKYVLAALRSAQNDVVTAAPKGLPTAREARFAREAASAAKEKKRVLSVLADQRAMGGRQMSPRRIAEKYPYSR